MTERELADCRLLGIDPAHVEACRACGNKDEACDLDIDSWASCALSNARWRAGELERAREVLRKHGATL